MTRRVNQRTWVVISIVLMAVVSPAAAKVIYVDVNAPGPTYDGSSWEDAYHFLKDALADAYSAAKPVEIRVAQGIYKPDRSSADPNGSGSRAATFQLINGVTIKGGYAGHSQPEPNKRDPNTYESILSGDLDGNDVEVNDPCNLPNEPTRAENSYHVVTGSNTDETAVIDGFTITAGYADKENTEYWRGGGMYNYSGSPTVTNCNFSGNAVGHAGGGMANYSKSSPTLINCIFSGNLAGPQYPGEGGGMFNYQWSNPTLTNCTFSRNVAWSGGGMGNFAFNNPVLTNCTFSNNSAVGGGGMSNFGDSSFTLTNCTFSGNSASMEGGAIRNNNRCNGTLSNCTFAANTAPNGNAIAFNSNQRPSNLQLTNCILWDGGTEIWNNDNSVITIKYSDVQGGWPGLGNIDADPCFADSNNGDYHLKSQAGRWEPNSESWVLDDLTSPCIDAGNPGCPEANEPAPNGNRINMGAYGGTAEASKSPTNWRSIADTTNDWVVDSNDLKVFVSDWLQMGECIPSDLDRSQFVDFNDFAILGGQWQQKGPGPGITYNMGSCIPVYFSSSTSGEFEPTRFTVTVQGRYILFEDMMQANCCPDELELQMTVEDDLITIDEIEHLIGVPCPCFCDYPITATLGPFEPGIYILEVYQDGYFVGSTTIDITPGS